VGFGHAGVRFDRGGRAHTRVRCANGCRARVSLVEQSTQQRPCDALDATGTRRCRTIARASLDLPAAAHARTVTFALTATGRRLRRNARTHALAVRTAFGGNFGLTRHGEIREVTL
jgi:hypothetical protein